MLPSEACFRRGNRCSIPVTLVKPVNGGLVDDFAVTTRRYDFVGRRGTMRHVLYHSSLNPLGLMLSDSECRLYFCSLDFLFLFSICIPMVRDYRVCDVVNSQATLQGRLAKWHRV